MNELADAASQVESGGYANKGNRRMGHWVIHKR